MYLGRQSRRRWTSQAQTGTVPRSACLSASSSDCLPIRLHRDGSIGRSESFEESAPDSSCIQDTVQAQRPIDDRVVPEETHSSPLTNASNHSAPMSQVNRTRDDVCRHAASMHAQIELRVTRSITAASLRFKEGW
jgi:hypothetical protein